MVSKDCSFFFFSRYAIGIVVTLKNEVLILEIHTQYLQMKWQNIWDLILNNLAGHEVESGDIDETS